MTRRLDEKSAQGKSPGENRRGKSPGEESTERAPTEPHNLSRPWASKQRQGRDVRTGCGATAQARLGVRIWYQVEPTQRIMRTCSPPQATLSTPQQQIIPATRDDPARCTERRRGRKQKEAMKTHNDEAGPENFRDRLAAIDDRIARMRAINASHGDMMALRLIKHAETERKQILAMMPATSSR
jgi:hypothetical protein